MAKSTPKLSPLLTGSRPTRPSRWPFVVLASLLLLGLGASYLEFQSTLDKVEQFCSDQVIIGGSSAGIEDHARALGFHVLAGPGLDKGVDLILIREQVAFVTIYCDITHSDGKVIKKKSGWE